MNPAFFSDDAFNRASAATVVGRFLIKLFWSPEEEACLCCWRAGGKGTMQHSWNLNINPVIPGLFFQTDQFLLAVTNLQPFPHGPGLHLPSLGCCSLT